MIATHQIDSVATPSTADQVTETSGQLGPIRGQITIALVALAVGGFYGLFQAIERLGTDLYPSLPIVSNYYQGLTVHGVLLALVFTFAFSNGLLSLSVMRGVQRPLASDLLNHVAFWLMLVGVVLAAAAILANQASVLYTFYAPLAAHPAFYLGLTLAVVSTWVVTLNLWLTIRAWRTHNPGSRIPLLAFMSIVTYLMWCIASVGVAVEILVFLLPWSLGLVATTDPQITRTLFWFSAHAIVYAWLLPAYVSWYGMLPRQVGVPVFSDPLARLTFLLFLVLSIPVGIHHQYTESGISQTVKIVHGLLTFGVFFPSMITAFSVIASLEMAGRRRGGRGVFGWLPRLPWGDPSVTAQILAGLVFALGGGTGLILASYNLNLLVHNTAYVPGHFHLTVGTAVALSLMGISYWLVPYLTGNALWGRRLGVAQAWLWAIGVLIFSRGQMAGGLESMPRRTAIGLAPYNELMPHWAWDNLLTAVGGIVMVVSGLLFFLVVLGTLFGAAGRASIPFPVAEVLPRRERVWPFTDAIGRWVIVALVLIGIAYIPAFIGFFPLNATSPTFKLW